MKDCVIQSRVDAKIKEKAIKLFDGMGLTVSEAIRLFLYQSVAEKGLPFQIRMPNVKTRRTLKQAQAGKSLEETTLASISKAWDDACEK